MKAITYDFASLSENLNAIGPDIIDTLHDIIVDYPTTAVESGFSEMGEVMQRVGVLNTLYHALKSAKETADFASSLVCK